MKNIILMPKLMFKKELRLILSFSNSSPLILMLNLMLFTNMVLKGDNQPNNPLIRIFTLIF